MSGAAPYIDTCPVGCAAPLETTGIVLSEGPLRRCPECGQLASQASAERYWESMAQFDAADFNLPQDRELARRSTVARRRLALISALLGRPPRETRVLDVGCSRGQFVRTAADLGFRAEGVEPAPHVAAAARASGLTVHAGLLEEQGFADGTFDALTLFEVVEHLRQPIVLLRECRRVLAPGGILMLSTGNARSWTVSAMGARWDYFHIAKDGGHVSFFNPASIRLLATRSGFETERIETRRVKFHEKGDVPQWRYAVAKAAAEFLNLPACWCGRGHDMLACLRRPA